MDCVVCTEILDKSVISCIPCGHVFHLECLGTWLTEHKHCPMCRKEYNLSDMTILYLPSTESDLAEETTKKKWELCITSERSKLMNKRETVGVISGNAEPHLREPVNYFCDCDCNGKWGRPTKVHPVSVMVLIVCAIFVFLIISFVKS